MAGIFRRIKDKITGYSSNITEARKSYKTLNNSQQKLFKKILIIDLILLTITIVPLNLILSSLITLVGLHSSIRMILLCSLGWLFGGFWAKKVTPKVSAYFLNRHLDKELLSLKKDIEA